MLELLQEERALTVVEAEQRLERIRELNAQIDAARNRCEQLKMHYEAKIVRAQDICDEEISAPLAEIEFLTRELRRYAEANITGRKRSLDLPSGTLSLHKRQPIFYLDGQRVTGDNPALIELARNIDADLIKVKTTEAADWAGLKKRLTVNDDGTVYVNDTGEVLADMRAQILPDDFKVETA